MPTYSFSDKNGETVERFYPLGEKPARIRVKGRTYYFDITGGNRKRKVKHSAAGWPMWSDACGINPEQIPEAVAADRALGVSAEYHPKTGQIKFENRAHRRTWCEAHHYFDRNGGYGDPQRR